MNPSKLFQYASDLHLEFQKQHEWAKVKALIEPKAPYLLLAGDIAPPSCGVLSHFLAHLTKHFEHIFLIPGNHEQQTRESDRTCEDWMNQVDHQLRKLCEAHANITFLQNEAQHFPDTSLSIFGGTFWTAIDPTETQIPKMIYDQRAIPGFTTQMSTTLHNRSVIALEKNLQEYPMRDWIILSHHLPSTTLIDERYRDSPYNSAFASDIPLVTHPNIKAWVQGHTHTPLVQPPFQCNPKGYPGENLSSLWKPSIFSIEENQKK